MFFTKYAPVLGALAGMAMASPAPMVVRDAAVDSTKPAALRGDLEARTLNPATFHLSQSWEDEVLFSGLAGAPTDNSAGLDLNLIVPKAAVKGDIQLQVTDKFLSDPTVHVDLSGVSAYFEVNVEASEGVFQHAELISTGKVDIEIPGASSGDVAAAFALDLVIAVSAAIELNGGFYISFPQGSFVEISALTKEITRHQLAGLIAQPLDMGLGANSDVTTAVDVNFGLRMRSAISVGSSVGLSGLDIGQGAEISIWVDLFSYKTTLVRNKDCLVFTTETFALGVGIAVEMDVPVTDVAKLEMAPMVFVTVATAEVGGYCLPTAGGDAVSTVKNPLGLPSTDSTAADDSTTGNSGSADDSTAVDPAATTPSGNSTGLALGASNSTSAAATGLFQNGTALAGPTAVSAGTAAPSGYVTSTISETKTYTITSCLASVVNCPATLTQKVVTSTVIVKTTVCPVTATGIYGNGTHPTTSSTYDVVVPVPTKPVTTVTLTSCPPITSTFTKPADCPTPDSPIVTITDSPPPHTTPAVKPPVSGSPSAPVEPYPTASAVTKPPTTGVPPVPTYPAAVTSTPPVAGAAGRVVGGGLMALALPVLALLI